MALQWDESLEFGFEEIDSEHRAIFAHFEKLSKAVQEGEPQEIIEQLANFLFEYTHVHFAHEEEIMLKYMYPKIDVQRREHDLFSKDANLLKGRIEEEGATRQLAIETIGNLIRWITRHIKKHDREIVEYIKEFMALQQKYSDECSVESESCP